MSTPLLFTNALIVPVVEKPRYGSLVVEDGRIQQLHRDTPSEFNGELIDCGGRILMPGLINAHLHPELHILKGIVEEMDLHEWEGAERLDDAMALLGSDAGRHTQEVAVRAALVDCILSGCTTVATYGVTQGADEVTAKCIGELGVRGMVTIRDVEFTPAGEIPASRMEPPRFYRLHAEEALNDAELSAASKAHARGERLVMHAAETEHRIELIIKAFGTSTIRLLERYRLLSERMLLSHAVHIDADEIKLLASNGVPVVSSPTAEMKLSDGVARVAEMLDAGVTVAIGTDGAICNNSNDMFREMRQLGLAQKLRYGAQALSAEQILLLATVHGARALGYEGRTGALKEGMEADLIMLDVENPRLQPLIVREEYDNVAANIVYCATGQDVTDVMRGGRWLVRDRVLQTGDPQPIWRDLREAAVRMYDTILK